LTRRNWKRLLPRSTKNTFNEPSHLGATLGRALSAALHELQQAFGQLNNDPPHMAGKSEGAVQALVRLEATRKGKRLFRNNVGAGYLQDGSFIRWGLANDSKAVNDVCKSSDLIGISPELITAADVGQPRGRFIAREIKEAGWQYSPPNANWRN
jgi:hypothetical protein